MQPKNQSLDQHASAAFTADHAADSKNVLPLMPPKTCISDFERSEHRKQQVCRSLKMLISRAADPDEDEDGRDESTSNIPTGQCDDASFKLLSTLRDRVSAGLPRVV